MASPNRRRPEPLFLGQTEHEAKIRTSLRSSDVPLFSASPRTSLSLSSACFSSPATDQSSPPRDRFLLDSFGQRHNDSIMGATETPAPSPLFPIREDNDSDLVKVESSAPDIKSRYSPEPSVSPRSGEPQRRHTVMIESRPMLPTGSPQTDANSPDASIRRRSTPGIGISRRRRTSVVIRQALRSFGSVHFGDARSADIFVAATSLRRASVESSSGDDDGMSPTDKRLIRVRVRPRSSERRPFVIQRNFDLQALRSTIVAPSASDNDYDRRQSVGSLTPTTAQNERLKREPPLPDRDGERTPTDTEMKLSRLRNMDVVPIHIDYARQYLPVLAALMLSGYIGPGDSIDLPLPHPEVWAQTVSHVYTGQPELTFTMKRNILYLGGKV